MTYPNGVKNLAQHKKNKLRKGKAKRRLYQILEEVLIEIEDGIVKYKPNWSDLKVHERITSIHPKGEVTISVITALRNRGWGNLHLENPENTAKVIENMQNRIDSLQEQLNNQNTSAKIAKNSRLGDLFGRDTNKTNSEWEV